jgi:signal transduction histidine kinase/ActR/RegA family two-component response regulator
MKNWRLTHRILMLALVPLWTITILLTSLVVVVGITQIEDAVKVRGSIIVRGLAPASEYGVFSGNRDVLKALTKAVMREDDVNAVMIIDAEHNVLALSGKPANLIKHAGMIQQGKVSHDDHDFIIVTAPIYQGADEEEGFGLLNQKAVVDSTTRKLLGAAYLELNTANSRYIKNMFVLISLLIGGLGILAATILALRMSRDVTRPLSALLEGVNQMAQGNLETRIAVNSSGELAELEQGFNVMAIKLESARNEILDVNSHLEQLVVVRTQQLEDRNQTLVQLSNADQLSRAVAEDATRAKSNFLAVANHDLRQPMHALNLYLGVLSDQSLPDSARPILSNVKQCAQAMDVMFRELLDISRLDAHMLRPELQAFPLATLLDQIQMEFAPQAQAKGLSLHVVNCSAWVHSDPSLLERIVRNLVSNAVRYTTRGKILIGCRRRNGGVSLLVCDSGQGIAPDQQSKVFDEFYQVNNPERDRTLGLGLGLATVKRLTHLLNIPLTLHSSLGSGSVFSIDLPTVPAGDALPMPLETSSTQAFTQAEKLLVVVIDDERLILNATKTLIEHWGFSVIAATSGEDALQLLSNLLRIPDAIICDNRLRNNVLGTDVIAMLRNEFNQDIPGLLITGDTSLERLKAIELSGMPVLFKPLQDNILRGTLWRLVSNSSSKKL